MLEGVTMGRRILPVPGLTAAEFCKLTRQQRYQLRKFKLGICFQCGKGKAVTPGGRCVDCVKAVRERARVKAGSVGRYERAASYQAEKGLAPNPPRRSKGKAK
jgi:hypothetical protein